MNNGATIIVSAAFLALSTPAIAHGGGMGGHFSGMGDKMGDTSRQTVIGDHDGDRHDVRNRQDAKTSKTIDKTDSTRPKILKIREVLRIEREIRRLRFDLVKLRLEGRGDSHEARLLRFQVEDLGKQLAVRNS